MSPVIKFSHNYRKLGGQSQATLLAVLPVQLERLSREFRDYDTEGVYRLPPTGNYLLLLFQREGGLFTTLRSSDARKIDYYKSLVGQVFDLVVTPPAQQEGSPR